MNARGFVALIVAGIFPAGNVLAKDSFCWKGSIQVDRIVEQEDRKDKEDPRGTGTDSFRHHESVHVEIRFRRETGRLVEVEGKTIQGSLASKTEIFWQNRNGICRKRMEAGRMPQDVKIAPGDSERSERTETADLREKDLAFHVSLSVDEKEGSYLLDFSIGGLEWVGNSTSRERYETIDRKTCRRDTKETRSAPLGIRTPWGLVLGGKYKGKWIRSDRISGNAIVRDPSGGLREVPLPEIWKGYSTSYAWDIERVPCNCPLENRCRHASDWNTCASGHLRDLLGRISVGEAMAATEDATLLGEGLSGTPGLLMGALANLRQGITRLLSDLPVHLVETDSICQSRAAIRDENECRAAADRVGDDLRRSQDTLGRSFEAETRKFEGETLAAAGSWVRPMVLSDLHSAGALLHSCR